MINIRLKVINRYIQLIRAKQHIKLIVIHFIKVIRHIKLIIKFMEYILFTIKAIILN